MNISATFHFKMTSVLKIKKRTNKILNLIQFHALLEKNTQSTVQFLKYCEM